MSTSLQDSIRTGEAAYVDTGRPNAFDHYSTRTMYFVYASSHYYPAIAKFLIYFLYIEFVGQTGGALPMILTTAVILSWIFAPIIFCPQISDAEVLMHDLVEIFAFVFSTRDKDDGKSKNDSLDKFWRLKEYKFHADHLLGTRIVYCIFKALPCFALWAIAFGSFVDYAFMYIFMLAGHMMLTFTFWFSNYSNVIRAVWMVFPFVSLWGIRMLSPQDETFTIESLMGAILFMNMLRVIHWVILIIATILVRCTGGKCWSGKRYKKFIGNLYFLLLQYHEHLYSAVAVCTVQSIAMFVVMLIWWVYGWLLRFYQWSVVRSAADQLGHNPSLVKTL